MEVIRHPHVLLWVSLGLCLLAPANATKRAEDKESEPQPDYVVRRLTPPPIVQVTVDVPSERADLGQNTDCSTFFLRPRHVRFFFRHAQAVSKRDYNQYYDWTECRASGTLKYANGMRAEWTIEIGGRGILMPTNGRRKDVLYYLNCEACAGFGKPE